jgi:GDP-4-dehydro-6-deoxy-D-mannose reductase
VNTRVSPILVTGATGFAGGHMVERLAGTCDLVAWGRSTPRVELAPLAKWQVVDLLDRELVRRTVAQVRPAAIVHLAGSPQVARSWVDAATPLEVNVLATAHLLEAVRRAHLECRVLVAGSAAVYAPSDAPIREDAPLAPANPYALSKLAEELLALGAVHQDGLDIILVRPFNHTGPRQSPEFVAPGMARQIALAETGRLEPVIRVGNLDARRDFTDVRDMVRAYQALLESGRSGRPYNIGSGVGRSIQSVLDALLSRARVSVRVETDPARLRPVETTALVADPTRLHDATGWRPAIAFEQTLDDLLEYWRDEVRRQR